MNWRNENSEGDVNAKRSPSPIIPNNRMPLTRLAPMSLPEGKRILSKLELRIIYVFVALSAMYGALSLGSKIFLNIDVWFISLKVLSAFIVLIISPLGVVFFHLAKKYFLVTRLDKKNYYYRYKGSSALLEMAILSIGGIVIGGGLSAMILMTFFFIHMFY